MGRAVLSSSWDQMEWEKLPSHMRLLAQSSRTRRVLPLSATTSWPFVSFSRTGVDTAAEGRSRGGWRVLGWIRLLQKRGKMLAGLPQNRSACAQAKLAHHRRPLDVRVRCPARCSEVPRT